MTAHSVVIAGGGPTGLMLAGELALAGVDVVVVERRADQQLDGSRSGGLHARTLEILDQRGIAERFVAAGQKHPALAYAGMLLDIGDLPTRHNYVLALWQKDFEPILADWVAELGVPIHRNTSVTGFAQSDGGVDVEMSNGRMIRAEYLVGCDGGRSVVRRCAGIDFAGSEPTTSWMIAEADMAEEPEPGMRRDEIGTHGLGRMGEAGPIRVVVTERHLHTADDPGMEELREALTAVYGTDFGVRDANWISRFTDATRQAVAYRDRRVLLAGDAAHVHPPHGGQGLNTGVQDAVNLGWKLALVLERTSPESLLDTYQAERHPVGARVRRNTMAQVALSGPGDRIGALRDTMEELLAMDEPRTHIAAMLSGLDIHYQLGGEHPLVGRRMPDLDIVTADGPARIFSLLHDARPLLVDFGASGASDLSPWEQRVRTVAVDYDGGWELPVLGEITAPPAVLVRPDGYVGWVGDLGDADLLRSLTTWFGAEEAPG